MSIKIRKAEVMPSLLVAAIDFGTTFSGYAFSLLHEYKKDPLKISTATWTAGSGGLVSLKTSTCVLFDSKQTFHSFGYEAEEKYSNLALDEKHLDWFYFSRFKMILYNKKDLTRETLIEDDKGKKMKAIKVFSSAIGYLRDHLMTECKKQMSGIEESDVMWVLTVPAIWDDKSKQFMREAAEKEHDMASWLEVNDLIYNKKLNAYKDFRKKDALCESKAADMEKDVDILKTWYRSIRTRFTRLMHRKSGDGSGELTERDRWILQNFAWLNVHVVEVKKKTTVSMRDKISAASSVEDVNDELEKPPEAETTSRQRLEPLPSVSNNKKAIQEEERLLLSNIANRGVPCSTTAIFSSATAVPSYSWDFLWYCIEKRNVATSSSAVAYNRLTEYVCVGVAESCLGQGTDDQPTADSNDAGEHTPFPLSNRATTSTSTQSAEQSFNLSSLINSSMEMCNTSLDRAVVDECRSVKSSDTGTILFDTLKSMNHNFV
uniref:Heat shock 70 kDa protein 12B n=1 Tax=Magallana gigas TaxID=29159 RepID=K1RRW5_MAGGI